MFYIINFAPKFNILTDTTMKKKELFEKELARVRRKIAKYNQELENYVHMTGSNDVPDIECTVIGMSPMEKIQVTETPNGIGYADDGFWQEVSVEEDCGEYWLSGVEELEDLLRYNRRRLRKGVRVWKSENPDAELEKDDDED